MQGSLSSLAAFVLSKPCFDPTGVLWPGVSLQTYTSSAICQQNKQMHCCQDLLLMTLLINPSAQSSIFQPSRCSQTACQDLLLHLSGPSIATHWNGRKWARKKKLICFVLHTKDKPSQLWFRTSSRMGQDCIAKSKQKKGQRKEGVGQGRRKSSRTSCCLAGLQW